jgi:hypothetical protein
MELRHIQSVSQVDIRFTDDGTSHVPQFDPADRKSIPLPMEMAVDGGFKVVFTLNGERFSFGIGRNWNENDSEVAHLYNFRTQHYTDEQLQAFQGVFGRLHFFPCDNGQYLGLKDGRGLFDLTPFQLTTGVGRHFLGYFILYPGNNGETRHALNPDVLFLGEIVEVSLGRNGIPGELFARF